jgi:hypothetical protein
VTEQRDAAVGSNILLANVIVFADVTWQRWDTLVVLLQRCLDSTNLILSWPCIYPWSNLLVGLSCFLEGSNSGLLLRGEQLLLNLLVQRLILEVENLILKRLPLMHEPRLVPVYPSLN